MKKALIIIAVAAVVVLAVSFFSKLFGSQYNSQGVSSAMVISIDDSFGKEEVGSLDSYTVYTDRMDPDELYFITVNAKRIYLKEALAESKVSVEDWRKKAWSGERNGSAEILKYENYEIVLDGDECIIRPLTE